MGGVAPSRWPQRMLFRLLHFLLERPSSQAGCSANRWLIKLVAADFKGHLETHLEALFRCSGSSDAAATPACQSHSSAAAPQVDENRPPYATTKPPAAPTTPSSSSWWFSRHHDDSRHGHHHRQSHGQVVLASESGRFDGSHNRLLRWRRFEPPTADGCWLPGELARAAC